MTPTASIKTDVNGGLWYDPIPGDMLRTYETTPQVIHASDSVSKVQVPGNMLVGSIRNLGDCVMTSNTFISSSRLLPMSMIFPLDVRAPVGLSGNLPVHHLFQPFLHHLVIHTLYLCNFTENTCIYICECDNFITSVSLRMKKNN